ncbi:hypothetical protein TraAM80_05153 [Trypanosoma rangeli]|uniref:Uncharacterized protein n=1 Tax=Trypanosoma rangeli TaxID=5698 RepID=A0A422NG47_TRYRA|nr:uncharacterized protein TraAM80_05153 [Trypanosoma rangeli]RNF04438.1 hypothetical protein TraAM80_05153 [Trypanosoma rangeli]|eukprot:RNF04438.1 hypothetical protein TraAM80_05153 [Trypanosoma rangeli]
MVVEQPEQLVTCLSWNNEGTNLAVGLTHGFIVYSTELLSSEDGCLHEVIRWPVLGGVSILALHGQSNLVILVGWEVNYRNTVTILDLSVDNTMNQDHWLLARAKLPAVVNALRFHPCMVLVGVETGPIYVFDHTLRMIESFEVSNPTSNSPPRGDTLALGTMLVEKLACGICYSQLYGVILGPKSGTVRCICYATERHVQSGLLQEPFPNLDKKLTPQLTVNVMELHRNEVRCITTTPDGVRALTVSERGTSLKLIDVENHIVVCQFSRGATPNVVHALGLLVSSTHTIAACISGTGTFHLFYFHTSNALDSGVAGAVNADRSVGSHGFMQAWSDYRNSVCPKARLLIPEDELYNSICRQGDSGKSIYSMVLRPVAKKDSCVALVVQRCMLPQGITKKARILSVQAELSLVESMKIVRSFYFPKDEL